MAHVDPEILALIALGEDAGDADDAAHLTRCAPCATELEELRHVVALGRESGPEDVPADPPSQVWKRIRAELHLGEADGPADGSGGNVVPIGGASPAGPALAPTLTPAAGDDADELAARRRRRTAGWLAAAASAGIVVGSLGGAWWASNQQPGPEATVLAEATLDPLPGWEAAGSAAVHQNPSGARVVVVQVDGELGEDNYREVWLLAPDLSGMVSLGLLEGSSGEFVLPAGIDVERYSVVDVSAEPFDGDATHSGNSIVRGPLGA